MAVQMRPTRATAPVQPNRLVLVVAIAMRSSVEMMPSSPMSPGAKLFRRAMKAFERLARCRSARCPPPRTRRRRPRRSRTAPGSSCPTERRKPLRARKCRHTRTGKSAIVFCVSVETLVIGSSNRSRIGWLSASNRSRALGSRSRGSVDAAGRARRRMPRSRPRRGGPAGRRGSRARSRDQTSERGAVRSARPPLRRRGVVRACRA